MFKLLQFSISGLKNMSAYSFGVTPITCHAWNGKGDGKID